MTEEIILKVPEEIKVKELKEINSICNFLITHHNKFISDSAREIQNYFESFFDMINEENNDDDFLVIGAERAASVARSMTAAVFDNGDDLSEKVIRYKGASIKRGLRYGRYIILEGSLINPEPYESLGISTRKLFEELREKSAFTENGILLTDVETKSSSQCVSLITGSQTNGKPVLKEILWE